jgi:hypothetical protein
MSKKAIRVLHDFDNPYPSGRQALRRGVALITYAISKKIPMLRPLAKEVYRECFEHCLNLAQTDKLLGIESRFGIKDEVDKVFPELRRELIELGFPVHRHVHHSRGHVSWDPPLDIEDRARHFDQEFARTGAIPEETKWVVFHADYPRLLSAYIRFIAEAKAQGRM